MTEPPVRDDMYMELARLAGGLAHEIKNPLSAIKLNLNLLAEEFQRSGQDDSRNLRRLRRVQDEVQRLHDTLEEFLRFVGNQELRVTDTDLRRLVEELVDFFRPQAEAAHVVLRVALPDRPVPCRVDPVLIKQAVLNLMINAVQAMSTPGDAAPGGELLVRLTADDGRADLEVIDTGPGVPPDLRERIFDAYFSTRPGGSGLGLPTTRRIVRRHHGEISIDGGPGQGTRFLIRLPLAGGEGPPP